MQPQKLSEKSLNKYNSSHHSQSKTQKVFCFFLFLCLLCNKESGADGVQTPAPRHHKRCWNHSGIPQPHTKDEKYKRYCLKNLTTATIVIISKIILDSNHYKVSLLRQSKAITKSLPLNRQFLQKGRNCVLKTRF